MATTRQAAEALIKAQEAYDQAEKALKQAKAEVKDVFARNGITVEIVDNKRVEIIDRPVPKYDVEQLATLVSARIYKMVTKPTLDKSKFDSAVELGVITPEVVSAVDRTTRSVFPQVFDVKNADAKTETNVTSITKVS